MEKIVIVKIKEGTPQEKLADLYRIENNLIARLEQNFGRENKNFFVNEILPRANLDKKNNPIETIALSAALITVFKEGEAKPVTVLEKDKARFENYVKQLTETFHDRQLAQQTNRMKMIELYDDIQYWN